MSSAQSGLVAGNKQNEAGGKVSRSRSRFQLSDSFFTTERFADYSPCFVFDAVDSDKVTLNQPHQVRTYTLKSPLMQNILKKKDYFMVPLQAMLPINFEKFYTQPTIGDDVPLGVGTSIPNFWGRLWTAFISDLSTLKTRLNDSQTADNTKLISLFLFLTFYEMFYSKGSLMKNLRISGDAFFNVWQASSGYGTRSYDFDGIFDECMSLLSTWSSTTSLEFVLTVNGKSYVVELGGLGVNMIGQDIGTSVYIGLREALELMRDDFSFNITFAPPTGFTAFTDIYNFLDGLYYDSNYVPSAPSSNPDYHKDGVPLNFSRLCAYQLVCAHYYSNDHIDVLYSAELYRQYMFSLYVAGFSSAPGSTSPYMVFTYNGQRYQYDALSGFYANVCFSSGSGGYTFVSPFGSVFNKSVSRLAFLRALFGFNKSLRFMDYFTGSRSRPLAVGDSSVDVQAGTPNYVDILDLAKATQATRFLQAVNRSGRKFSAYMLELFGKAPKPDFHNPFYLAHTSDVVGSSETENTGAAQQTQQNSITSILRSNASRYAFTFEPDRDCVIIGITYYDLPRVYTKATDRQNFILDRADMYNPLMQYIGDQEIYTAELGTPRPSLTPFSYTNRDMQYKQRFNFGAGGFCAQGTQLGSWFFKADTLRRWFGQQIGSSFIRSFNAEFDQFYVRLTGWSLGTYFHFIVRYDNRCDASRPMAYAPGIMQ